MKTEIHHARYTCLSTYNFMLSYTTSYNSIIENLKIYTENLIVTF